MTIPSAHMTQSLRTVVRRGIARWRRTVALQAISLIIAGPLVYLWFLFVADNLLHLPAWLRLLACITFFVGLALLLRNLLRYWRQQRAQLTEDRVALAIEQRAEHGVQNRLINSLQLSRSEGQMPSEPSAYLDVLMHENYEALQRTALKSPVRLSTALPLLAGALLAIGIGAAFWTWRPDHFGNAATRLFLPLADVEPIYRTHLTVEPGDTNVERDAQLPLRIYLGGQIPEEVTIITQTDAGRQRIRVPLAGDNRAVTHLFEHVRQDMRYAVIAGDNTAPPRGWFHVRVLHPPKLLGFEAVIHPPAYTQRDPQTVRNRSGELEALAGARADVRYQFDQPARSATITLESTDNHTALSRDGDAFTGSITFADARQYSLRLKLDDGREHTVGPIRIAVIEDQPPSVDLAGLNESSNVNVDTIAPLTVGARDDVGLRDVQLCAWALPPDQGEQAADSLPSGKPQVLSTWQGGNEPKFSLVADLVVPTLGASEGDRYVIAARARDHDPRKQDRWTYGRTYMLHVTSPDAELQIVYDKMLATEASIGDLLDGFEQLSLKLGPWLIKLESSAGASWDRAGLATALKQQAQTSLALRGTLAAAAQHTAPPARSVQMSLAMLADTEAARVVQVIETAAGRNAAPEIRNALVEGRVIAQRIGKSLERILAEHVALRQDWELSHMTPYVEMMARRQHALADASRQYADRTAATDLDKRLRESVQQRQTNLLRMTGLASQACAGLARRVGARQVTLSTAFATAADALRDETLRTPLKRAGDMAGKAPWPDIAAVQSQAADAFDAIHKALRDAQKQAARDVMAKLQEQGKITVDEQGKIEELIAGTLDTTFTDAEGAEAAIEKAVRMVKTEGDGKRFELNTNDWIRDAPIPEQVASENEAAAMGPLQHTALLDTHLADRPGGQKAFPDGSDLPISGVNMKVPNQTYEDVMGALLEEADDLRKDYDTYNHAANGSGGEESGTTGKNTGHLNAISIGAVTGNMKPPTHDYGGGSAVGRGGGRAHGMALGNEARSMRGRDEAQQGQERAPIQEGSMREVETDDPQKDFSTGFGGKQLDTKDPVTFSTKDAGEWDDQIADMMGEPGDTHKIVERMGKPMDPKVAKLLRDIEGDQEQLIERIKTIRKQFDSLYLPTEHLDQIADELTANLDRLKHQPDAEVFRKQLQTLDRLRSVATVYNTAGSGFEPALPRRQSIDGYILDESPQPAMPGYERATEIYYRNLAGE